MNRIFVTVAAAALMGAGGVALAQQDANNPAPNYASTPAVQNHQVKHIEDGVNAAPRYSTVAPAGNSRGTVAIQDGKPGGTVHARQHTRSAHHG